MIILNANKFYDVVNETFWLWGRCMNKKIVVCAIVLIVALALVLVSSEYGYLFKLTEFIMHCLVCHLIGENIGKFFMWLFDK